MTKQLAERLDELRDVFRLFLSTTPDFVHGDKDGNMPSEVEIDPTEAAIMIMQLVPPQYKRVEYAPIKGTERTIKHVISRDIIEIDKKGNVERKHEEKEIEEEAASMGVRYFATQEVADIVREASDEITDLINNRGENIGGYQFDTSHIELDDEHSKAMLDLADRLERELKDE